MARVLYRKLRSRGLYANQQAFRRVVIQGTEKDVRPLIQRALQARIANWSAVVAFAYTLELDAQHVSVHVFPAGDGAKFWLWVSRGVAGHPIPRAGPLFRRSRGRSQKGTYKYRAAMPTYRYSPKTSFGNVYGRPAFRQFYGYTRYVPFWPGITARLFEENVALELKVPYQRLMENIMRRAVNAAKREAT